MLVNNLFNTCSGLLVTLDQVKSKLASFTSKQDKDRLSVMWIVNLKYL